MCTYILLHSEIAFFVRVPAFSGEIADHRLQSQTAPYSTHLLSQCQDWIILIRHVANTDIKLHIQRRVRTAIEYSQRVILNIQSTPCRDSQAGLALAILQIAIFGTKSEVLPGAGYSCAALNIDNRFRIGFIVIADLWIQQEC